MQSVAKRSEGTNIYKLSNHANGDQDASPDHPDDITKKPAATALSDKEPLGFGDSKSPEASDAPKDAAGEPAASAASSADDALAWLKIIQNATADLTADIREPKGDAFARSFADEEAPFGHDPLPSSANFAGNLRRNPGFKDEHEDYGDERQLAQRLSYRYAEKRSAPPQTLGAAVMPYVAATGVLAFLAGSAAVYFLMGSSSPDVKARVAPADEAQFEAPMARPDLPGTKKGGFQRAAAFGVSGDNAAFAGSKAEEQGARPAEPAVSAEHPGQTWSDTVQTFKQFVRPEQK